MANKVDTSTLVRKGFHLSSPVWLIWYWMPPDAWVGIRKEAVLVSLLCVALVVEAGRLISGRRLPGFRGDEADRISSYAWGSLGLALGLLFFPGEIVIVTFWGMAWIDPLCAYTRRTGGYPWVPFVAYILLAMGLSFIVVPTALYQTEPLDGGRIVLVAVLAAVLALWAERPNLRHIDDDFLMNVIPMVILTVLALVI